MATLEQLEDALRSEASAGNVDNQQRLSDAIRAHPTFQRNAREKLESEEYRYDENFMEVDKNAQRANMSKYVARSLGLNDDEVDVTQGMGTLGRMALSFKATDEEKFKSLEERYGRENIRAVDIGGKQKMLYRDPEETGGQFRAVDEEGTSLADFFGDTAGSALPVAGAIGAAVATGGASIPLTALAAAGGGFAAGAGQDIASRAISGDELQLGEIAKRRGIEAAIGIPIDMVTGVGGKFVSKAVGKRAIEKGAAGLTKEIDDIVGRLDADASVRLTPAQETSTDASLKQSIRAGIDPEGAEARAYAVQRDEIGKLNRILRGEDVADEPIEDVMQNVADRQFKLIDAYEQRVKQLDARKAEAESLAKKQTKAQKQAVSDRLTKDRELELQAMRDQAERSIKKMTKGRQRLESAMGDDIREQQRAGQGDTEATSKGLYDEFYRRVDTQQAHTPISKIEDVLKGIDDSRLIPDSPEMRGLQSLRKRVSDAYAQDPALRKPDFLDFKELDGYVRDVTDGIRYNKTHGFKQSEKSLQDIGRRLDSVRDKAMSKPKKLGGLGAGTEAKKAYKKAQEHYKNKVLPYFDGDRAANLSRVAGGRNEAVGARGENVLARTFATRASVRDAIDSGVSRDSLKKAYIDKVVNEANGEEIAFDRNVLAELYSTSKNKEGKRIGASKFISDLERINKSIKASKGSSNITARDVEKALGEFEPKARAKALRAIDEKAKAQEKLKKARQSALNKIIKGEMPTPDDIHHFVDDISKLRPGQIKKLRDRLPSDRARASLSRSGYDALLEKAGSKSAKAQRTGKATGRESLWEPDTMHKILNNSTERAQWEALIGEEAVKDIEVLNKWLLSSAEIRETSQESIGRFVTSTGASGTPNVLFVSPQLPRWIGRKMLGVIHTSPLTRGMMRRSLKEKQFNEETFMKLFYTAMGTRRGMDAITDEMGKDPAFSAWVQESMKDQPQEQQQPVQ